LTHFPQDSANLPLSLPVFSEEEPDLKNQLEISVSEGGVRSWEGRVGLIGKGGKGAPLSSHSETWRREEGSLF
jgi:hypothetical protein